MFGAGLTSRNMHLVGDEDLRNAAKMLITTALRVAPNERFVAVGDLESAPLLATLEAAAREAGAEVAALRLDLLRSYSTNHTGERPHKVLPDAVRRAMLSAQASAFIASALHGEGSMRDQLLHIVGACSIRHAHMPGISQVAFAAGLAVDYERVRQLGKTLETRLDGAHVLTAESNDGTHLSVRLGPHRWVKTLGRVRPGQAVAFPAGSLIACPETVNGTFVADASVGEFFGAREGLLRDPVTFEIEDGRVTNVRAPNNPFLVKDIEAMLRVAPNSDRVGLAILGVNVGIGSPTGEVSVDRHRPGLHLVFGDPQAKSTGAEWSARTSFAACQTASAVSVDGDLVIEDGTLRLV